MSRDELCCLHRYHLDKLNYDSRTLETFLRRGLSESVDVKGTELNAETSGIVSEVA